MKALKIEKGIPIPSSEHTGRKGKIAPLMRSMKVGDSILFSVRKRASAYGSLYIGKGKYATRKEGSRFRIWRTK